MLEPTKIPPADLDPLFVKALKLLNSKSKDSTEQLKQMLDEVIDQKKAELALRRTEGDETQPNRTKIFSRKDDLSRKRDAEKANLDKLKQELIELSDDNIPHKKSKLEIGNSPATSNSISPRSNDGKDLEKSKPRGLREIEEDIFFGNPTSSLHSFPSRGKDLDKLNEKEEKEKETAKLQTSEKDTKNSNNTSDSDTEVSDTERQGNDFEEMQFELELGNLSCVVCKSLNVTSSNRLVECQECHSLYHQECHKPPVTENVNDPRFVWYCHKCVKNLKKIVTKTSQKKTKPLLPTTTTRESPIAKPTKNESTILQPFKRIELVKPATTKENSSANNSNSATPSSRGLSGLASLAANLSGGKSSNSDLLRSSSKQDSSANRTSGSHSSFNSSRSDLLKSDKSRTDSGSLKSMSLSKGDSSKSSQVTSFSSSSSKTSQILSSTKTISSSSPSAGSKFNSSSSSSSGNNTSNSNSMNNDKRFQMMKKAVAKMSEKR